MSNRVLGYVPLIAAVSVSLMLVVDLGTWAYQRQEVRYDLALCRAFQADRERQRQEAASHIAPLSGPACVFVGRDGQSYVWVDSPGGYHVPAFSSFR